jgi:hypothetical protein
MKSGSIRVLFAPVVLWLLFYLVSFIFGFLPFPNILQAPPTFATPLLIALFFGLWIGIESYGNFKLMKTLVYAFIISFLVGLIQVLITEALINFSPLFLNYTTYIYTQGIVVAPIFSESIGIWIGMIFGTTLAAGVGFALISKLKSR